MLPAQSMRAVVQRVSRASVSVDAKIVGEIGRGLLVFLGVEQGDSSEDLDYIVDKTANLRIFADDAGKMNLSVQDVNGGVLAISQFTLLGDCRRGRRPGFTSAAGPEQGNDYYEQYCRLIREMNISVAQGIFRADMQVELVNDGPVTLLLDSRKQF